MATVIPPTITIREKLVIVLCVFMIQMVKPWEYSHQFNKFWEEIKEIINQKP